MAGSSLTRFKPAFAPRGKANFYETHLRKADTRALHEPRGAAPLSIMAAVSFCIATRRASSLAPAPKGFQKAAFFNPPPPPPPPSPSSSFEKFSENALLQPRNGKIYTKGETFERCAVCALFFAFLLYRSFRRNACRQI